MALSVPHFPDGQLDLSGDSLAPLLSLNYPARAGTTAGGDLLDLDKLRPLTIGDRNLFRELLVRFPSHNSGLSFANLFAWDTQYVGWAQMDGHLIVMCEGRGPNGSPTFMQPIGPNPVALMEKACRAGAVFVRVNEELLKAASPEIPRVLTPDHYDYLYTARQNRTLAGSPAKQLRYRLRNFADTHQVPRTGDALLLENDQSLVHTEELTSANIGDAHKIVALWMEQKANKAGGLDEATRNSIEKEAAACTKILDHWAHLPEMRGVIVYVRAQHRPISLAIGEWVGDKTSKTGTFVSHFAKSDIQFEGLPIYVSQRLCLILPDGWDINRMQDLGRLGLRTWKRSWVPLEGRGVKGTLGYPESPR